MIHMNLKGFWLAGLRWATAADESKVYSKGVKWGLRRAPEPPSKLALQSHILLKSSLSSSLSLPPPPPSTATSATALLFFFTTPSVPCAQTASLKAFILISPHWPRPPSQHKHPRQQQGDILQAVKHTQTCLCRPYPTWDSDRDEREEYTDCRCSMVSFITDIVYCLCCLRVERCCAGVCCECTLFMMDVFLSRQWFYNRVTSAMLSTLPVFKELVWLQVETEISKWKHVTMS